MSSKDLLFSILRYSGGENNPDVHLNTGKKPFIRNSNGHISIIEDYEVLDKKTICDFIKIVSSEELFEKFEKEFELDLSYSFENGARYRTNCYIDTG